MKILKVNALIGVCVGVLLLASCSLSKTSTVPTHHIQKEPQKEYVKQYYREAVRQMKLHGIPASITLAQGILETGSGKSTLARKHNNHFGIKCSSSWRGKRVYAKDNTYNDCFRSYKNWEESFEDHSLFLKQRRYHSLFNLRATDYRGWAKGLQRAGYATNKAYANRLIDLIERYDLHKFDRGSYPDWLIEPNEYLEKSSEKDDNLRQIYISSGLRYVIAGENDSFSLIAKTFGLSPLRLARYNEAELSYPLRAGSIVYLEPKYAVSPIYQWHTVERGESMYNIAQRYGMQVKSLYVLNDKSPDYVPTVGDRLRLR